jgi:transcriptional regulator with XRE-family HTH domain
MDLLGRRLRELREQRGLTVRQVADRIEKTPGYVSRIEVRGEIPSPELLCVIADVYGVEAEKLLDLAKRCYLERTKRDVEAKNQSALVLHRRARK